MEITDLRHAPVGVLATLEPSLGALAVMGRAQLPQQPLANGTQVALGVRAGHHDKVRHVPVVLVLLQHHHLDCFEKMGGKNMR